MKTLLLCSLVCRFATGDVWIGQTFWIKHGQSNTSERLCWNRNAIINCLCLIVISKPRVQTHLLDDTERGLRKGGNEHQRKFCSSLKLWRGLISPHLSNLLDSFEETTPFSVVLEFPTSFTSHYIRQVCLPCFLPRSALPCPGCSLCNPTVYWCSSSLRMKPLCLDQVGQDKFTLRRHFFFFFATSRTS